jgi:hypothetical protein
MENNPFIAPDPLRVADVQNKLVELPNGPAGEPSLNNAWLSLLKDGADMLVEELPPVVEVIAGIVTDCSKLVIGSGSKSFKTWITIHAALAIAHGNEFWGRQTARRRVLYVNLELKEQTFTRRLQTIARELNLKIDKRWFIHLPLRGKLAGLPVVEVISRIIAIAKHLQAGVVVIDPIYKLNTEGDENSSRDQTRLFNDLDRITTEAQCMLILNDHFGKGNQSEKDPLDAIRGSSAKGGDVDAAMILRKHEVEGCFRVDLVHRELPPVEPFCIGWKFPLMELRPDLDADDMKKARGGRARAHDPMKILSAIEDTTHDNPISGVKWAERAGVARPTLANYVGILRAKGFVATTGQGNTARQFITDAGKVAVTRWRGQQN